MDILQARHAITLLCFSPFSTRTTHTRAHAHTHTHAHVHAHTHTHTHTHTHKPVLRNVHSKCERTTQSHVHTMHSHMSPCLQVRKSIPCHITDVSCGRTCDRLLPCQHKCQRLCHKGECLGTGEACQQPCTFPRKLCQHQCGSPCHPGKPCPDEPCKARIVLKCPCGRKKEPGLCQADSAGLMQKAFQA